MPDMPIAIATDKSPNFDFDKVITIENPEHSFLDQIYHMTKSPFERSIYLDTDIYMVDEVSSLFNLLRKYDLAAAYNHNRCACKVKGVPDSFPEYNTGVIVYKNNNKLKNFTQEWQKIFSKLSSAENLRQNQPSFRKALYESSLRLATLTTEYNCMVRYPGHIRNDPKLLHSRLLDIDTPGADYSVHVENAAKVLKSRDGHRLFKPSGSGNIGLLYPTESIFISLIYSIKINGLVGTFTFLIKRLYRSIRRI
ncbi:hypothetical protein GGP96_002111 [Salinibacter ruber]|nr:hypothetical protein [Salinibacter ruber]